MKNKIYPILGGIALVWLSAYWLATVNAITRPSALGHAIQFVSVLAAPIGAALIFLAVRRQD